MYGYPERVCDELGLWVDEGKRERKREKLERK